MCLAPQRRALFPQLHFQKSSEAQVFCTFLLRNVLRATTACTFSTSQLAKIVRTWCVLYMLTAKCASRHNGVQLLISYLASYLRTRRFSEPTFRPSGATKTKHWKTQCFATFLPFHAPASSLFWLSPSLIFSLLTFSTSDFLPGSASSWLCFSSVNTVGSFTSKLPSMIYRFRARQHSWRSRTVNLLRWLVFTPKVRLLGGGPWPYAPFSKTTPSKPTFVPKLRPPKLHFFPTQHLPKLHFFQTYTFQNYMLSKTAPSTTACWILLCPGRLTLHPAL